MQQLVNQKSESFDADRIKRSSVAAAPLALWVKANIQYSIALEKIAPLELDLSRLTKSLDASKERVDKLKNELDLVDQKVSELRDNFSSKTKDAEVLKSKLEKALETINSASGLLEKLSGEGLRWKTQVKSMQESLNSLPQNTLLAAAFVTYLGEAQEETRKRVLQDWCKLTSIPEFSFMEIMSTESEQLTWKHEGLPSDLLSLENAPVILNGLSVPLIVDPNGQATKWLKTHLEKRGEKFELIRPHDSNFLRSVELAVRFGKILVVQDVTEIDACLFPLLRKELIRQGSLS